MQSPAKTMASAAKASEHERHHRDRWCLICNRELITCRKYFSVKSSSVKAKRDPQFLPWLRETVGETLERGSQHLCEQCESHITKIRQREELKGHIISKYKDTKSKRLLPNLSVAVRTPSSSPKSVAIGISSRDSKRKAAQSPGTPSTRKVSGS